jgi:hypothetical protein
LKISLRLCAWASASLLVGLTACKKRPAEVSTTAYIIGPTNDILRFSDSPERKKHTSLLKSMALIATKLDSGKIKFCSGVLVKTSDDSVDRILTNHHCFAIPGDDGKATKKLLKSACTDTTIYFGFSVKENPKPFFTKCKEGSLESDFQGDIATFLLKEAPPEDHKRLALMDEAPEKGAKAMILHYPDVKEHMAKPPESHIMLPEAAITTKNCTIEGPFPRSEWILDRTLEHSIRHTCDLVHGSSGSGLVDAKSNKLIGINWGGIKVSYSEKTRTDNVATSAAYIRTFLGITPEKSDQPNKARTPQSSNSIVRNDSSPKKKDKTESTKVACGVVGKSTPSQLFLIGLFLPVLLVFRRKVFCFSKHS